MSAGGTSSRRDFLRGLLRVSSKDSGAPASRREDSEGYSPGHDWLSLLPPEFSGVMLRLEAARLGGDPETMSENDMAALVVQAMYGTAPASVRRQEAHGPAREEERGCVD